MTVERAADTCKGIPVKKRSSCPEHLKCFIDGIGKYGRSKVWPEALSSW